MEKEFDLIVFGATSFTGRLVAQYLNQQYGSGQGLSWAMAGRNLQKLEKVRRKIRAEGVPLVVADSHDRDSLDQMCARTRVVASTVGPYALYGSELVAACVAQGCHYCDLSGEVQWMRRMIDQHHAAAQAAKVKIVHSCGFDSIPSDLGVYFLQKQAKAKHRRYCQQVRMGLKGGKGGFSGGTLASLNNVLAEANRDPWVREVMANPYALNPEDQRQGPDGPDRTQVEYDAVADSYLAPFVMAAINTRVVRRSHALLGQPYGTDFRYEEVTLTGSGWWGQVKAQGTAWGMGLLYRAKPGSPLRWVMDSLLPKPGEGPSEQARKNGFFKINLYGYLPDGEVMLAQVTGDRDPGYGSTSRMLAESAVSLAQDDLPPHHGVITPSVAMGEQLLERLPQHAGVRFALKNFPKSHSRES